MTGSDPDFCRTCAKRTAHEPVESLGDWGCGYLLFGLITLGLYFLFAKSTGSPMSRRRCRVCGTES